MNTTDQGGYTLADAGYDAYGTRFGDTAQDPYGYGGQWGYYTDIDTSSKLILCTYRYYDPTTGRWLTRDPIGYDGGVNLYGYVEGNPVNWVDPRGTTKSPNPAGCAELIRDIIATMEHIVYEIRKFDPKKDAFGNVGRKNWPDLVEWKPDGHRKEIKSWQNRLKNLMRDYNAKCRGCKSISKKLANRLATYNPPRYRGPSTTLDSLTSFAQHDPIELAGILSLYD